MSQGSRRRAVRDALRRVSPLSAVVYGLVGLAGVYQALFWKRVQSRWMQSATQHAR